MSTTYSGSEPFAGAAAAVLLCTGLRDVGSGIDLAEVEARLARAGARVRLVDHLCSRPDAVGEVAAGGTTRAVLGLCDNSMSEPELHHRARKAGLEPFGLERVNLGALCARALPAPESTDKAVTLLRAAIAKVEAFRAGGAANVKPRLLYDGQRVSRRALFTLPPIRYEPVAAVTQERCASATGCDLCVGACPRTALAIEDGRVVVAKGACDACGICVSECPRGAVDLAGASLPQIEAQLNALLRAALSSPKAILFGCGRSLSALEESGEVARLSSDGWLPVRVPCAGMIRPGWLLQSLASGASSVGVLSCRDDCAFGQSAAVEKRVEYCEVLLETLGHPSDSIRLVSSSEPLGAPASLPEVEPAALELAATSLREPRATALAVMQLNATRGEGPAAGVAHPAGPLGVVEIDAAGCTACEACVRTCPTAALTSGSEGDRVTLEFDPAACNACGLCEATCPESVVSVRRVTDVNELALGTRSLHLDAVARCEHCDARIAPDAMMRRVRQLLGDDTSGRTLAALRLCASCRGMGATGSAALRNDGGAAGTPRAADVR